MPRDTEIVWRSRWPVVAIFAVVIMLGMIQCVVGAPPAITITDGGYFVTVVEDGIPRYERITQITDLRESDTDPPIGKPDGPAPPPTQLGKDVSEWASEVDDGQAAQRYALAAEVIRDAVATEKIPHSEALNLFGKAADALVDSAWSSFRNSLSSWIIREMQSGGLSDKSSVAKAFEAIRYGLGYSATGSEPLSDGEKIRVISEVNALIDEGEDE